ncbi:glycosyltransferase family protein [Butyrivibrio proteoclasticus]|uniref:glycosyltransferase family protein n=1 Tax=Butyrivibrio proteoclasticus TaxID=43305 RepID=UPI0006875A6C|nr:glycosyltransferase family protein [Butyrivibrio proteoclasticus]
MNHADLYRETEQIWQLKDRKRLAEFLEKNEDSFMSKYDDIAYCYFFSKIELEDEGAPGLLFTGESLAEVLHNIVVLRRLLQRLEWCNEYPVEDFLQVAVSKGITPEELYWLAEACSIRHEHLLARINGEADYLPDEPEKAYYDNSKNHNLDISFISCTNNEEEFAEMEYYIRRLHVPDGCNVDVLGITDAKSMCAGYNEGMQASSASIKVYLHHDVRIVDRFFLHYILNVFDSDPDIGIAGMVGTKTFADDGVVFHSGLEGAWIEGKSVHTQANIFYVEKKTTPVLLVDGLLLATRVDIPWREDLFDAWHFYDASQCMEFKRAGYKAVVPYQESPWCLHECGWSNVENYFKYSEIFRKEYFG